MGFGLLLLLPLLPMTAVAAVTLFFSLLPMVPRRAVVMVKLLQLLLFRRRVVLMLLVPVVVPVRPLLLLLLRGWPLGSASSPSAGILLQVGSGSSVAVATGGPLLLRRIALVLVVPAPAFGLTALVFLLAHHVPQVLLVL